ncbi:MAG: hypothetical protein JO314_07195 [Acidobacteria bacterium]|nr:hypothetical protein [Acidobacteriota bacterium]
MAAQSPTEYRNFNPAALDFMEAVDHLIQAGFPVAFDNRSLQAVDGFLVRASRQLNGLPDDAGVLEEIFGTYLGECMCQNLDGVWHQQPNGGFVVRFASGSHIDPFDEVYKQLRKRNARSLFRTYRRAESLNGIFTAPRSSRKTAGARTSPRRPRA